MHPAVLYHSAPPYSPKHIHKTKAKANHPPEVMRGHVGQVPMIGSLLMSFFHPLELVGLAKPQRKRWTKKHNQEK